MNHRIFADELRADALTARTMAERLELRAAEHDALAREAEPDEGDLSDPITREGARAAFLRVVSVEACARRAA